VYIKTCGFDELANLSDFDKLTIYTAAAVHDLEHPGKIFIQNIHYI